MTAKFMTDSFANESVRQDEFQRFRISHYASLSETHVTAKYIAQEFTFVSNHKRAKATVSLANTGPHLAGCHLR